MLIVWEKKSGYKYIQIFQFIQLVNKWEGGVNWKTQRNKGM
jgi:hypothetical protein